MLRYLLPVTKLPVGNLYKATHRVVNNGYVLSRKRLCAAKLSQEVCEWSESEWCGLSITITRSAKVFACLLLEIAGRNMILRLYFLVKQLSNRITQRGEKRLLHSRLAWINSWIYIYRSLDKLFLLFYSSHFKQRNMKEWNSEER